VRDPLKRGEFYRVHKPGGGDPKKFRVFVVVSRQSLFESRFPTAICAPVYSTSQGLATQIAVGPDEGLKHNSWVLCDNLQSVPRSELTQFLGSMSRSKLLELDEALGVALDLE
jgi:mRNA interferase MazF